VKEAEEDEELSSRKESEEAHEECGGPRELRCLLIEEEIKEVENAGRHSPKPRQIGATHR